MTTIPTADNEVHETTDNEVQVATATILVVEDDTHLMEGIRDILELNKYAVLTATNGIRGLAALEEHAEEPPDLIVSDIMMPQMDGYEFFEKVRADQSWVKIPFIFLTAKGERDDVHLGKQMGAEDYVIKPFDAEDLLVAVDARLRRHRQVMEVQKKEVDEVKGQIMNIINHEFRTPLTYIVAYADMMDRDSGTLSDEESKLFLRGINAGANRLRRLVENFIMLVGLMTGDAQSTYEWRKTQYANYKDMLRAAISKYQPLAEEKQVSLIYDVADDLPPILTDAEYLTAALECLLDNAIKFTEESGKTISVNVYQEYDHVCFKVRDEGKGIPTAALKNIFKPFYQYDRETKEQQGAGSGLAIVAGVMKLHGGTTHVESTEDRGSTFTMRVPILTEETELP
ncbi:MAG: response regulator [Anaerolineae bacterium]|nr:response regulator [Anaerolineae bacterium]